MGSRLALLFLVVLPGVVLTGISVCYLFPKWVVLNKRYQNDQTLTQRPISAMPNFTVARAAENRHRLNCFAEGIGVLFGGVLTSIDIHGICLLPQQRL